MKITLLLAILFSAVGFTQNIKWEDNMNGDNSIAGLQARGWVVVNNDGGGDTPAWFQPSGATFTAFEGHDSGFVASNFDGANANGIIDHWLISPQLNVIAGDTITFYARSPQDSEFDDSIYIMISSGSSSISSFSSLGRFKVSTEDWESFFIFFNASGTIRFAINYYIFDGGPDGSFSDFMGLDFFRLTSSFSNYPATIQLSKSFVFGDPSSSSSYRLIGIPGNNNLPLTTFFNNGTHKTDWNVFYDNGAAENFLTEFNGQTLFNFTPGKGFWALSRNEISVSRQVNTVTLTGNSFNVPLHSGWNIISNPFEKSVALADIRNANNLPNAVIHAFSGNFTQSTAMIPYDGYYFLNPDGRTNLTIPYSFGTSLPKTNEQPYFLSDKSLHVKLISESFSSEVMIGFDKTAKNDYDDKDYFAPPGNFEQLNIRLINKNILTVYNQLFIEHRQEIGEGQSFDLQVKNETGKKSRLIIKGIENFSDDEIYLLDERLKKFYNLKDKNEIEISENHKNNKFSLLIGKQNFIDSYKDDNAPKEFALYQNYPNPFNPITLIRYQVPGKEHISIKVYDIIGNLVKILVDETKEPGYYETEFDGTSLSSGIYLYEFAGGSTKSIKKMTLIK